MESMTIKKLVCLRCGYSWFPKTQSLPKKCAGCASRYWNKEKKKNVENKGSDRS